MIFRNGEIIRAQEYFQTSVKRWVRFTVEEGGPAYLTGVVYDDRMSFVHDSVYHGGLVLPFAPPQPATWRTEDGLIVPADRVEMHPNFVPEAAREKAISLMS